MAEAPAQGPHSSEPPSVCARYPHAGRGRGASAPQKTAGRGRRGAVAGRPGLLKILLLQVKRHFENALPTTPLQQGILGYSALAQIHSHLLAMYRSRCLIDVWPIEREIESDDVMSEGAMTLHSEILTASSVFSFISQFFRISWLHFVR